MTTVEHPLDRWVDGVRRRSEEALRAVYEQTVDDLTSFAYGMLHHRPSAEDVVQEAFVELVRAADGIEGNGRSLRVWLFKSVRFRCLDELRRRKRQAIPSDRLPDGGTEDQLYEPPDPRLQKALGELSSRHRVLIVLRHVVGLSGEEIAEVTGTTRTAVYGALGRAERKLRSALDRAGYERGDR